jgi:hypothetical protein
MKQFTEAEIAALMKDKKMSMDEFFRTKDEEITIGKQMLEAEKETNDMLNHMGEILTEMSAKMEKKDPKEMKEMKDMMMCMSDMKEMLKTMMKNPDYAITFERDREGFIASPVTVKVI